MKYHFTFLLLGFLSVQCCNAQDTSANNLRATLYINKEQSDSLAMRIPPARGYVNDFVRLFTTGEVTSLDSLVSAYERKTTVEIAVATVDSAMVKGADFEDYTLVMTRKWGVGKKEKNNGILIVISPDLRRIRIQNGYGIEKILSDAETKYIIDNSFIPKFKEGKYFEGTRDGIIAIMNKLKQNGL